MAYLLKVDPGSVFGRGKYTNASGHTECVTFIQMTTDAPHTTQWRRGRRVQDASPGEIAPYTAIATFDDSGRYPTDGGGRHAAIYLSHDADDIWVLDQWNDQGEVLRRPIHFRPKPGARRSNDGRVFYVIV